MTPGDILKEVLEDPIFREKYGISEERLKAIEMHVPTNIQIVEIIKTIISANSNNTSEINTFRQIKTLLGLS